MITTNCLLCKKEYKVKRSRYNRAGKHFCSKVCYSKYRNNKGNTEIKNKRIIIEGYSKCNFLIEKELDIKLHKLKYEAFKNGKKISLSKLVNICIHDYLKRIKYIKD